MKVVKRKIRSQEYKIKETREYYKEFFYFETITNDSTHMPYLVRFETQDGDKMEFIGYDCALDMLNNLPDKKTSY